MPNLKKLLKSKKPMNNNQTKPTNQPNPNRFHLKTWQWVSVLILAAVIVGGVFVVWNKETQILPPCDGLTEAECKKNSNCSPHIIMADPTGSHYAGCLEKTPTEWAEEKGDYAYCDQEQEEQPKWWCYILVARKNKDLSVCDKIIDEKRVQQCYQEVLREINANQQVAKSVSVTTDKTEYEQGERVKVVVKNNSTREKCISPGFGVENFRIKWEKIRKVGCPCEIMCSLQQCENLKQGEVKEFSWDQEESWCSEPQGRSETMYQQVPGGIYRAEIQANGEIIYSNEFTIK
ncbi:MAG: hypothetical protein ABH896_02045 [Candidatus Jacksonbacteria bacterium]